MESFISKTCGVFAATVLIGTLVFVALVWRAYVLVVLWGWFVTPMFHLAVPSLHVAVGLIAITSLLTHENTGGSGKTDSWVSFTNVFLNPALLLLVGWIATLFM